VDVLAKLQIRPGATLAVLAPPEGSPVTGDAVAPEAADAVLLFVRMRADLDGAEALLAAARADRLAWVAYPKAGRLGTDLNRDRLAAALTALGVRPVRQVALDDTWSALRFRPAV
jgi:phage-related baseplate assembly protein